MVIKGEIQRVDKKEFRDKQSGNMIAMYSILVGDKTKQFRCTTPLQYNLSEERFKAKFGNGRFSDLVDEPVTCAIVEMTAKNAFISIRGEIVKGHHTAEAFQALFDDPTPAPAAEAPASPAGAGRAPVAKAA